MKALLDTHVFLWTLSNPKSLSKKASVIIADPENEIYVSVISFWEISLKYALGKLKLSGFKPKDLPNLAYKLNFSILTLEEKESASFNELERLHGDLFDRMLVWQAIQRNLSLISADQTLGVYEKAGLDLVW